MKNTYSPDILNCLANLSSDEVFTSPELANRMLDLLPQELFCSSKTRFLDPCSKSGVFLREITKRLLVGLEKQIPDLQQRIDHIMTKQVFGIACTDITAEMSRRTLYCTKQANGEYSVTTAFHDVQGNLKYERCRHTWNAQGRCEHCGASQSEYLRADSRETYAYPFIHKSIKEIFKKDMQFDVIIGNPPYQMSDGGHGASAIPIYHHFVEQAKKLNPRFLSMIIPARWYSGGRGLDSFRETMLNDHRLRVLYDYFNSEECFPGVDLSGGICYFLWNRDNAGLCKVSSVFNGQTTTLERPLLEKNASSFIRFNQAITIISKVNDKREESFMNIVSANDPFGYDVREENSYTRIKPNIKEEKFDNALKIHYWGKQGKSLGYIERTTVRKGYEMIDKKKIFISRSYGERGEFPYLVIGKPFKGDSGTVCTETYVVVGTYDDDNMMDNVISYMTTKMFRFLVMLKKNTQSATKGVYQFVPLQDFSHPWTDAMLYKKYNLDKDEIAFIESMIRPME